jgi:hypothetical protein
MLSQFFIMAEQFTALSATKTSDIFYLLESSPDQTVSVPFVAQLNAIAYYIYI